MSAPNAAASDYDDETEQSFRGDESVDAGDEERLLSSRGLADAVRARWPAWRGAAWLGAP